jgi:hypothetical protein
MSLETYRALPLAPDGPLARALEARLADEAGQAVIPVSPVHGADVDGPAGLTPAMGAWYRHHVAPARRTALAEIRAAFEAETLSGANRGFLAEAELDRIEAAKHAALRTERETFFQRKAIQDLHARLAAVETSYERKRAEHGRDARPWEPVIYFLTLALIALALEAPLNFESFLRIDYYTPAFATGSFLFVAVALAASGHIIGTLARQKAARFGGDVPGRVRSDSRIQLSLAVVLAALALGLVGYSRKYLLDEAVARSLALGETVGWGVYLAAIGVMIANLGVFVLSIWYAYARHDAVPDFAEERREMERLRRRIARHYRRDLEGRARQRVLQAGREAEAVSRREAEQARLSRNHPRHRALFEEFLTLDARVLALMEDYRSRLVATARRSGLDTRFVTDDLARGDVSTRVEFSGEAYLAERLRLRFA